MCATKKEKERKKENSTHNIRETQQQHLSMNEHGKMVRFNGFNVFCSL